MGAITQSKPRMGKHETEGLKMKKIERINLAKKAAQIMDKGQTPKAELKALKAEGCTMTKDAKGYHFEDADGKGYQLVPKGNMVTQYNRNDWVEYRALDEMLAQAKGKKQAKKVAKMLDNVKAKSLREDLIAQITARGVEIEGAEKPKAEKPKAETVKPKTKKPEPKAEKPKIEVLPKDKQHAEIQKLQKKLKDVEFEVIGSWVWASGETREHKDELKKAGFRFSGNRQAWYWKPTEDAPRSKRKFKTMDGVRNYWQNRQAA